LLNVAGVSCLYASLWFFFFNSWRYNDGTFEQVVPIISIIFFGLVSIGFMLVSMIRFGKTNSSNLLT